ncbi:H-NS family nucleoid-associated regulatory protein [Caballeronia insecticola]|uniref:Histone family protein nucleoid-structuring protein H-NS n=1 Tax=Caballeronia insecticola TaxID=758793 RepID=A0A060PJW3_9BURK|nr:H-NS family nucleoid-associated regulatory protein [Caballeronia insecticola]BAO94208.1 histone family protein nucleoid-structuring protein H-NS [Caballeronia insecticola]
MATLKGIQSRIAKLQAQAEAIAARQSSTIIARIRSMMKDHGISIADITAATGKGQRGRGVHVRPKSTGGTSIAKYRDPKTGATWTGHGRAPAWIASAKNRDKFRVDGAVPSSSPAVRASAKPGNQPRGPQPAKYRDPKSGAEWSGRGRAPAWLATVKDRTRFLIAQISGEASGTDKVEARASQNKTRGAQKASAEKTSAKKGAVKAVAGKKAPAKSATKKAAAKQGPLASKKARAAKKPVRSTSASEETAIPAVADDATVARKASRKVASTKPLAKKAAAKKATTKTATTKTAAKKSRATGAASKKAAGRNVVSKADAESSAPVESDTSQAPDGSTIDTAA